MKYEKWEIENVICTTLHTSYVILHTCMHLGVCSKPGTLTRNQSKRIALLAETSLIEHALDGGG